MIKIKNLFYTYPSRKNKYILNNINIDISRNELIAIMGSNGSGKSTFAKAILGLIKKTSGSIIVDNLNIDDYSNIYKIRCKVNLVFQNPTTQNISPIVKQDVAFGPENLNLSTAEIEHRIDTALATVDMMNYKDSYIQMLSGGQAQKIAIAGILAMEPDYIIFDESTSMISNEERADLLKNIIDLNKIQNKTIIFITHNIREALLFNRLIVMDCGKIILDGKPHEILLREQKKLNELHIELPLEVEIKNLLGNLIPSSCNVFCLHELANAVSDLLKNKI
jgi:energy-coupling factor transport system ATP-binding protein